jgi:hypothetical protein
LRPLPQLHWVYDPSIGTKPGVALNKLDRSAAADLWRNTLSQIPTVFGRLVYLASLRNSNSGRYEHHGLALVFGEEEANKALKKSHTRLFREWLTYNLEEQKSDLESYLSELAEDRQTVLTNWSDLALYRNLMPLTLRAHEKRLYMTDLKALLELMGSVHGVGAPDPGA